MNNNTFIKVLNFLFKNKKRFIVFKKFLFKKRKYFKKSNKFIYIKSFNPRRSKYLSIFLSSHTFSFILLNKSEGNLL